jgi:hypothetical protein
VKRALDPSDTRVWIFSDEALEARKPEIVDAILEKFENDSKLLADFAKPLGFKEIEDIAALIEEAQDGSSQIKKLLNKLMGI